MYTQDLHLLLMLFSTFQNEFVSLKFGLHVTSYCSNALKINIFGIILKNEQKTI